MGHLHPREFVRDRLRLGLRQSYRIVPSSREALVSSDDILALLNRSRVRICDYVAAIPSDLMTAEELAATPELADTGLTARRLLAMTRREVKVPPHFRLNSHCIRFSRRLFLDWLSGRDVA